MKQTQTPTVQQEPVARLMIRAFRSFEKAVVAELRNYGIRDITLAHLNVIRHLNPEGLTLTELANDAGLTKQAIGKMVSDLEAKGYLEVLPDANDFRAKQVLFTEKGSQLVKLSIRIITRIEDTYRQLLGDKHYRLLRSALTSIEDFHNETT